MLTKQVKSDFAHIRFLMKEANKIMKTGADDYSESSDAGQLALELIGCAHSFAQWCEEQQSFKLERVNQ